MSSKIASIERLNLSASDGVPDIKIPRLPPRPAIAGPKVSVVMPTYRRPHYIGETIRLLLEGTWTDFELIVQDDGDGRDGTAEAVARAAQGDARVRYFRNEHKLGIPDNLNAAIQNTRGEFIAMCHDHDVYAPSFLAEMVETLARHPTALYVHCAINVISQRGAYVQSCVGDWPELSAGTDWLKFLLSRWHCPVCALTVVRRSAHEQLGLYDASCGFIADIDMWMRLAQHGDVAYVRRPLIGVREREAGHMAAAMADALLRTTLMIHRRHLPQVYGPAERLCRQLQLQSQYFYRIARERAARIARRVLR